MEPRINLKATNISLTSEHKDYFSKRIQALSKVLDFGEPTLIIDAELARTTNHHDKGDVFMAEINVNIKGEQYRAVSEREDLMSAIDEAKDEILLSLKKRKEKKISFIRRGGQRVKDIIRGFYGRK